MEKFRKNLGWWVHYDGPALLCCLVILAMRIWLLTFKRGEDDDDAVSTT